MLVGDEKRGGDGGTGREERSTEEGKEEERWVVGGLQAVCTKRTSSGQLFCGLGSEHPGRCAAARR
jgi:hypothetical protein